MQCPSGRQILSLRGRSAGCLYISMKGMITFCEAGNPFTKIGSFRTFIPGETQIFSFRGGGKGVDEGTAVACTKPRVKSRLRYDCIFKEECADREKVWEKKLLQRV